MENNGVERVTALAGEGPAGFKKIAELIGVSAQAVYNFRARGFFPLDKARIVNEHYPSIPLADLVREDIAAALRASS